MRGKLTEQIKLNIILKLKILNKVSTNFNWFRLWRLFVYDTT